MDDTEHLFTLGVCSRLNSSVFFLGKTMRIIVVVIYELIRSDDALDLPASLRRSSLKRFHGRAAGEHVRTFIPSRCLRSAASTLRLGGHLQKKWILSKTKRIEGTICRASSEQGRSP